MIKASVTCKQEKGINYILDDKKKITFKPWLGDTFSFLYDHMMENSVFPNLFGGDIEKHTEILKEELGQIHNKKILELGAGSGIAASYLPSDNVYTGIDICPGLLKRACKRFEEYGFNNADFYVAKAEDLPFEDNSFDICLCMLSLNFFDDIHRTLREIQRVLAAKGTFCCAVPVPERKKTKKTIHGTLLSEKKIQSLCTETGFTYHPMEKENGALLYFRAVL